VFALWTTLTTRTALALEASAIIRTGTKSLPSGTGTLSLLLPPKVREMEIESLVFLLLPRLLELFALLLELGELCLYLVLLLLHLCLLLVYLAPELRVADFFNDIRRYLVKRELVWVDACLLELALHSGREGDFSRLKGRAVGFRAAGVGF